MDLAERSAFGHLDDAAIRRAADRWLRPHERAWCAAQPSFREGMVVVLSCKEAVYKAGRSPAAHEASLTMHRHGASGWAVGDDTQSDHVAVWWEISDRSILALAVAAPAAWRWQLLQRILEPRHSGAAPGPNYPILPRCRDTSRDRSVDRTG